MKKIIVAFSLLSACSMAGFAQCDKKVILHSSKTEYLDASYAVQRTVDEKSTVEIDKSGVTIAPGNAERRTGAIQSDSCNWKVPFKEGKSIIKVIFTREDGTVRNATITIEGKDGKVTLLMEMAEMPDRKIRVSIDKFEENK